MTASLALEISSNAISFSFLQFNLAEFKVTIIDRLFI